MAPNLQGYLLYTSISLSIKKEYRGHMAFQCHLGHTMLDLLQLYYMSNDIWDELQKQCIL